MCRWQQGQQVSTGGCDLLQPQFFCSQIKGIGNLVLKGANSHLSGIEEALLLSDRIGRIILLLNLRVRKQYPVRPELFAYGMNDAWRYSARWWLTELRIEISIYSNVLKVVSHQPHKRRCPYKIVRFEAACVGSSPNTAGHNAVTVDHCIAQQSIIRCWKWTRLCSSLPCTAADQAYAESSKDLPHLPSAGIHSSFILSIFE